jgi:predicted secreted protein
MRSSLLAIAVITLSFAPFLAQAQEAKSQPSEGTIVTLTTSDQKKVEQDILMASLRIEVDNKDAKITQDSINKTMQKAIDLAKSDSSIKVSTGNYYVYSYDPNPSPKPLSHAEQQQRMIWKGSQSIELQSKDAQKVLAMVAKIQDMGFVMNGLNYVLSPELAEAQKDALLVGALKKIETKAGLVAKTLNKTNFEIIEVNIDGSYIPQPQPVMMMKAERADMAGMAMSAPVAAPSETDVMVSVTARVLLKP